MSRRHQEAVEYLKQALIKMDDSALARYCHELVENLLRYGAVKTFFEAGKYFKETLG